MNLLVPSVGRKRYLCGALREALYARGGRLFGADLDDAAPALAELDLRIELPPFGTDDYWSSVDRAIHDCAIDAVLPVRGAELVAWAERAEAGRLAATLVSSPAATLQCCSDKDRLYRTLRGAAVACPDWALLDRADPSPPFAYPLIAKPVAGAGSRGVLRLLVDGELAALAAATDEPYLLQPWLGGQEYSIDCYALPDGRLARCCPRRRLVVVDGECVVGELVSSPDLVALAHRVAAGLRFRGVFNLQAIDTPEGPFVIDVNPRFPGGIAISERAGCGLIEATVAALHGGPPPLPLPC